MSYQGASATKQNFAFMQRGFTLIELLVTVVILVILLTLALMGTKRLVEEGKKAACMGNLKTVSTGMMQMVADNNGVFPQFNYDNRDITYVWPLLAYVPPRAFQCPSAPKINFQALATDRHAWDQQTVSYGYNYRFLAADVGAYWNPPDPLRPVTLANITRPSSVILMTDAIKWWSAEEGTGSGFCLVEPPAYGLWANPAPRHNKRANIAWVDGHMSSATWDHLAKPKDDSIFWDMRNWDWRFP